MHDVDNLPRGENTSLTPKEATAIILSEYGSLRAEILARTANMYQLFAGGIAVLLYVLTNSFGWSTVAVILAAVLLGGAFSWLIDRDIRKAARRLREIEHDVNRRVGEDLLIWESRWGGAVSGFFGPAIPLTKEEAEARLKGEPDFPWVGQILLAIWGLIKLAVVWVQEALRNLRCCADRNIKR